MNGPMHGFRSPLQCVCYLLALVLLSTSLGGCGSTNLPGVAPPLTSVVLLIQNYTTDVAPVLGEDLAASCVYDLYLAEPGLPQKALLVIYDRADSSLLFTDAGIRGLAQELQIGLLFPHQCNAASYGDIQTDAAKGPGRALFAALEQLAAASKHPELASANVLLYGFSAAGVLAATTTNYRPERVIGVVAYAAASARQPINTVIPGPGMTQVPFLLLANAQDVQAGTSRDAIFFNSGWNAGAPWGYAVQNSTAHCCNLSTRPLILPWIGAVVHQRLSSVVSLTPILRSRGELGSFVCTPNGTEDVTGYENCGFTAASIFDPANPGTAANTWFPDRATGTEWLAWVTN